MRFRILFFLFFPMLLLLSSGCGDYVHPTIPNAYVDFTIYPNDANYPALNHYGGYMYFTGGVNGIIIYRVDYQTFAAYDRACPYDWENNESWIWVEDSGLILGDSCCGSQFNVLSGVPIAGPAKHALKYYRTTYDGVRLRVHN